MDEDCVIVKVLSPETGKKSEATEKNSAKKLKQTLLCFKAVDPNSAIPSITNPQPSKKRRLSDVSAFSKSAKNAKKANSDTAKRKSVGSGVDEGDKEVSSSCEMEGIQPVTETAVHTSRPGNSSDLLMKFIHKKEQVEVSTTSSKDGEMAVEIAPESENENENEPTSTGENKDWVSQDETSVENKENIPDSEECQQPKISHSSLGNPDVSSKVLLSDADVGTGANVDEDANQISTANDDVVKSVVVDKNAVEEITTDNCAILVQTTDNCAVVDENADISKTNDDISAETTTEKGAGNCAILVQTTDNSAMVDENADISMTSDDLNAESATVNNDALKSVSADSAEKDLAVEEDDGNGTTADKSAVDRATVDEENISISGDADKSVPHTSDDAATKLQITSSSDVEKVVSSESSEMVVEEELESDNGKSGEQDLNDSSTSGEAVEYKLTESSSSNHESTKSEEKAIILDEKVPEKPPKVKTKRPKVPFPSTKKQKEEQQEKELSAKKKCKEDLQQQKKERKEQKERDRQEAKMQKEKERLEKEKEKEDKKRQKEEERQKKQEQLEEEKKKKEEARLEEKKKKEEEKRRKEEEKQDKEKVSQKEKKLMQNFFFKTSKDANSSFQQNEAVQTGPFMPFEPKRNMRLAPKSRVDSSTLTDRTANLDSLMASQSSNQLYLEDLKKNVFRPGTSSKTWPGEEMLTAGDVVVVETLNASTMKAKLFQFSENYRPAYYGTWHKQSQFINGRRPFAKDTKHLDYEVDSDDEWEEVEPGESLSHSEGEDETEPDAEPDDDEDGSFMVPHGYLSEGEGCEDEDDVRASPDELKACQLAKARNWDAAINTKQRFEALRPICIGICWWTPDVNTDSSKLKEYEAVLFEPQPITLPDISCCSSQDENKPFRKKHMKPKGKGITYIPVPEAAIPDLIRLVHGNEWSIFKVVKEFQEFWRFKDASKEISGCKVNEEAESAREPADEDSENLTLISKRKLDAKIRQIAIYERRPSIFHKRCWYVCSDSLEKHGLTELHVPNQWKWITKLPNKSRKSLEKAANAGEIQEKPVKFNLSRLDSSVLPSTTGSACAPEVNDKAELVTHESTLKTKTEETEAEITTSKKTAKNSGMTKHCVKRLGKKKSMINPSLIHCFITGGAGQSKMTSGNTTLKSKSSASNDLLTPKTVANELFKNPTVMLRKIKTIAVNNQVASVLSSGTQLNVIQSTGHPSLQPPKRPSDGCAPEPKRPNLKEVGDDDDCMIVGVQKGLASRMVSAPGSCSMKASMENTSN